MLHICIGTVYGIGANNYNEFGIKANEKKITSFQELEAFGKLSIQPQDIFAGYSRFTVKTHQDRIYSIGNNYNGACGCGKEVQIEEFKEIAMDNILRNDPKDDPLKSNNFVSCVSQGTNHMLFVLNDIIYSTGANEYGQCGDGNTKNIHTPVIISKLFNTPKNKIIQIECGYNHSILLSNSGKLYGIGRNQEYQCGIEWDVEEEEEEATKDTDTQPTYDDYGGYTYGGYSNNEKEKIEMYKTMREIVCGVLFTDISVGGYHNLCISRDNKLYIFGKNESHELGVYGMDKEKYYQTPTIHPYFHNQRNKQIIFTSTKHEHSMAIDSDNICYLWGANNAHQISKTRSEYITDITIFQKEYHEFRKTKIQSGSCGYNHTLLLTVKNHDVIGFGGNDYRQTNPLNHNKVTKDPHTFNNMEIGIKFEERIVRVIAGEFTSVLIQQ